LEIRLGPLWFFDWEPPYTSLKVPTFKEWYRQSACTTWYAMICRRYRHVACTKPVPLGQGKIKRDLSPVPGTGHWNIPILKDCPCLRDRLYTHDGSCSCPTCPGPNLSHKVGLQGRGRGTLRRGGQIKGVACIRHVGCTHPGFAPYLVRIHCPEVRSVHLSKWPLWLRASVPNKTLACISHDSDSRILKSEL